MKESGYVKDCECSILVGNVLYKGVIADVDRTKLKFIREIRTSAPIPTYEVVYIFNPYKNITAIHYPLSDLKETDKSQQLDLSDPLEKPEVKEKISSAIRNNNTEEVVKVHKEARNDLLSAIQKKLNSKPPPVQTTNYGSLIR